MTIRGHISRARKTLDIVITWLTHSHNNWIPWGEVEGRVILDSQLGLLLWYPLGSRPFLVVLKCSSPLVRWHMKIMYIKWCRCAFFFQCGYLFFPFLKFGHLNACSFKYYLHVDVYGLTSTHSMNYSKSFILIGSLWVHIKFPIVNLFIRWQVGMC